MGLRKRLGSLAAITFLAGCSSTSANKAFSIVGPMIGSGGLAIASTEGKEKEKPSELTTYLDIAPIYRHSLVKEVRNVPLEIRDVPIHPSDSWGTPGPISDENVDVGPRLGVFFRYGPRLEIEKDVFLKLGLEGELSGNFNADDPERNYTNAPGTGKRGEGAALTYYSIHTASGPRWNSFFFPKLYAGVEVEPFEGFSLGVGYSIWSEDLVAETGWDRYNKDERRRGFNLVDMTIGSVSGRIKYKTANKGFIFLEIGTQDILNKHFYDLGRKASIDFEDNSFTISVGAGVRF